MRRHLILIVGFLLLIVLPSYAGWTPPVRISDEGTSFGSRIDADGNTLHVVFWARPTGTNRVYYVRSDSAGVIWTDPILLQDTTLMFNCINPLIGSIENSVVSVWRANIIDGGNGMNFGFTLSTNGGIDWIEVSRILANDQESLQKHVFCIEQGVICLVYGRWAQETIIESTRSTDWGDTWSEPAEIFRTQETGRFDMASTADTVHFVWVGRFNYDDEWEIYYMRSIDSGESWSENVILSTADQWGTLFPSMSVNSRGDIVVCWMDYKYSPYFMTGDIFLRYSFDGGETWTDEQQLTDHHLAFSVRALWSGDSVHVAWEDWRYDQEDIFYRLSTDNGITWGDEERVEDDPGESGYPDIAVSGDNVHLVWNDFREDPGYGIYYSRREGAVAVDGEEAPYLKKHATLSAHPNPFNSSTILTFNDSEGGKIDIYNISGQEIRTLTTNGREGKIIWDARDALGNKISSGIYFARAGGAAGYSTIKLIYLR